MKGKPAYTRHFVLTALASSILLTQSIYALQELQDSDLSLVNAQDGLYLQTEYGQMDFDQLYWQDKAGTTTGEKDLRATANGVQVRKNPAYMGNDYKLGTNYKIQSGTTVSGGNSTAGLDLEIATMPSTISIKNFQICNQTAGTCDSSIGNLAIQTGSPQYVHFKTQNGLFDPNSQSDLRLSLQNINIYTGLASNSSNYYNQLILRNFNFNFWGKGVMYVDPAKGLMLQTNKVSASTAASKTQLPNDIYGYIDFKRVPIPNQTVSDGINATYRDMDPSSPTYGMATSSGLNIELMTKKDAYVDPNNPIYALTAGSGETNAAKGLIRVGASGRMVNSSLQIRGVNANNQDQTKNILGYATNSNTGDPSSSVAGANGTVLGSTGIGFRLHGEFTRDGDTMLGTAAANNLGESTKLEIGGSGNNTFGFEFSEISPLISNSNQRAYFDSGDIYLNLANTRHLLLPENSVLNNARLGGASGTLTTSADYKQQISDGTVTPNSVVVAIRGGDFQAVSKRGRFTSSSGVTNANKIDSAAGTTNTWGLGLPYYNLNSNIAIYSTKYTGSIFNLNNTTNVVSSSPVSNVDRLGLALGLSVQGRSTDGTKTTSIMVVDASRDYYIGLRNIDMLLRGYGSMGFENGNVNVDLKDLLMVMAAEIAGGYLPSYNTAGVPSSGVKNPFNLPDDVLFGLKLKMLGDMNFSLIPNNEIVANNGARLSIVGRYLLKDGAIQLSDPVDESMIGLDNISGLIQFNNAIVINKDNVGFNYGFTINPEREATNVLRVRDLNLYPKLTGATNTGQRLGEMVMTGGRINANMGITPRNGGFTRLP